MTYHKGPCNVTSKRPCAEDANFHVVHHLQIKLGKYSPLHQFQIKIYKGGRQRHWIEIRL